MDEPYDVGDLVRVYVAFTNVDGDFADPTSVRLVVKDPSGGTVQVTDAAVRDIEGHYHHDYSPLKGGTYHYKWFGTGAVQAASGDSFKVRMPQVL